MEVPTGRSQSFRQAVSRFFYREEVPYGPALVRILLPLILLVVMVPRWSHTREFYSADGATAPIALNYGYENFPPEVSGATSVAMMSVLIVSLACSSVGLMTRASLIVSTVLFMYLTMLDSLSTLTKYSVISTHMLLLLSISRCGVIWSIDSVLAARKSGARPPRVPVWPARLMQLFIGCVYFGAAMTKLQSHDYFTSDMLRWWLITNVNNANPFGEWLAQFPWFIVLMANVAIIWQIAFLFITWRGFSRPIALFMGVGFHLATTPMLGLYVFPLVMISSYCCFMTERDLLLIRRWVGAARVDDCVDYLANSVRWLLPGCVKSSGGGQRRVAWCALLVVVAGLGVVVENQLDPFGARVGYFELPVADPALAERLRSSDFSIRESDWVYEFRTGRTEVGGVLAQINSTFRQDEPFIAQVTLAPPHPDFWIECNLHSATGELLHRTGQVVGRERLRIDWHWSLPTSLMPGDYTLVLHTANGEVARQSLTLLPLAGGPAPTNSPANGLVAGSPEPQFGQISH